MTKHNLPRKIFTVLLVMVSSIFSNETKSKPSIAGGWDLETMGEDYEPYMVQINGNGTYKVIAEIEANNIDGGTWKKLKDGTYRLTDPVGFMEGVVTLSKDGNRITIKYENDSTIYTTSGSNVITHQSNLHRLQNAFSKPLVI